MRALVLNADCSLLNVTQQLRDGLKLMLKGSVITLATYDRKIRSGQGEHDAPAVVQRKTYANVGRRRHGFMLPSHKNIFVREGQRCAYCSCKLTLRSVTKDHVVPRCKGGRDSLLNVVACCRACNGQKADRTLADSGMQLRPGVELRELTEGEKLTALCIFHDAVERRAWLGYLEKSGLTLF